jgi:hypothetical protein
MNFSKCSWQGKIENLETHLSDFCQEEKVKCHHEFCNAYDRRHIIIQHQRICRKNSECEPVFNLVKIKGEDKIEGKTKIEAIAEINQPIESNIFELKVKKDLLSVSAISKFETQDLNSTLSNSSVHLLVKPLEVCQLPPPQIIKLIHLPIDQKVQNSCLLDMPALQKRLFEQSKESEVIPKKKIKKNNKVSKSPKPYWGALQSVTARKSGGFNHRNICATALESNVEPESTNGDENSNKSSSTDQIRGSETSKYSKADEIEYKTIPRKNFEERVKCRFDHKLKYDVENKARDVHINDFGDNAIYSTYGNLVLLNAKMTEGKDIIFSIIKGTGLNFGIGICFKSVVMQNNFEIKQISATIPGCYLIFADGYVVKNQPVSIFKKVEYKKFKMEANQVISIRISYKHKILNFLNHSTKKNTSIALGYAGNWTDVYPCVYLSKKNEAVRLLKEFPNTNS